MVYMYYMYNMYPVCTSTFNMIFFSIMKNISKWSDKFDHILVPAVKKNPSTSNICSTVYVT